MCGKGMQQTSSQGAAPNPQAMAAYTMGLGGLMNATSQPFNAYSQSPTSYVSPLTATQTGAIQNISGMQGMTDPYYQAASGLTAAGAGPVNRLTGDQITEYMNPYMSQVVDPVQAAMNQKFGQQLSQQQTDAIKNGAFGGSRSDVARALLQGQQGLAMGQTLSPLYQTAYGQALQTAQGQQGIEAQNQQRMLSAGQQFAGLGTGAQNAALQQAQAQLQGGTLEQQTRNAMLQAMYNEYQKQRMYPLQTAQIFAQGAAALGPLMGSYNQTYQPQPFFGGLASGGKVDGYEEGLGRARMGGAVHNEGDFARGGYAYGGEPDLTGLVEQQRAALGLGMPKEDIQVPMMQFTPGKAPEMAPPPPPREKGIVSKALGAIAEDPEKSYQSASKLYDKAKDYFGSKSSSLVSPSDAMSGYDLNWATGGRVGFAEGGDTEDKAMENILSHPIEASKPPETGQQKPEESKSGLGSLLKAGASMAANYFLPGSGVAVNAGLSALGMSHGGRAGYATEGSVEDDGFGPAVDRTLRFEGGLNPSDTNKTPSMYGINQAAHPGIDVRKLTPDQAKDIYRKEYWDGIGASKLPQAIREMAYDTAVLAGPGRAKQLIEKSGGDPEKFMEHRRDFLDSLLARDPEKYGKYAKAWENRNQALEGGVGAARADIARNRREIPLGDPRRGLSAAFPDRPTTEAPGPSAGLGSAQVKDKSFLERTQEHPESIILPVLKGLGAMAGSRSKYLGSALLEGLGAGAGSYMDMAAQQAAMDKTRQETATEAEETRKRSADVAQTEAMTGLLGAETGEKTLNIAGGAFKQVGNDWFVLNDRGQWVHLEKWRQEGGPLIGGAQAAAAANALAARVGSKAPAATPPAELPAEGTTITAKPSSAPAAPAATQPPPMPPTAPVAIMPGVSWTPDAEKLAKNEYGKFTGPGADAMKARSDQYVGQTTQGADAAISTRPMHADVAKIIAQAATQKGLNAPGVGFTATSAIVGTLNRIANAAGISGDVFGGARTQQDLSDKLNGISARLAASESGQHALGALESAIKTMPDLNKTPAASAENAADNIMNNQRAIDKLSHMRKYGSISNNRFSDADTAFNAANSAAKYNKERDALRDLILGKIPTPEGARKDVRKASEILEKMYDPNVPAAAIDKFFKEHYGLDNMSRYFR